MPPTVIVGSGVMGASAAYHLAARGHRDIVVIDRAPAPGAGSTARATGGFRAFCDGDAMSCAYHWPGFWSRGAATYHMPEERPVLEA